MVRARSMLFICLTLAVLLLIPLHQGRALELTQPMKDAISWIDQNQGTYQEIAKYIWQNPELSLVEFKSSAKLQEYLAANGFKLEKGVADMPTAFVATWGSGKPVIG